MADAMRRAAAGLLLSIAAGSLVACGDESDAPPPQGLSASAASSAPAVLSATGAARTFLEMLSEDEREAVLFDRGDRAQQQRWSNLPDPFFERAGLRTGDLDQRKLDAFLALMRATLSDEGFSRVTSQWAADDQLVRTGGANYGRDFYWIALIGEPSDTEPWQWQFGGHHVTVNATIRGDDVSLTPSFLGVQPAESGGVRPLGDIEDEAFALVRLLGRRAVLGAEPIDLVLGAGRDCRGIPPEGFPGSAMSPPQQQAFQTLIDEYAGLGRDATRREQLRADLPRTFFAWYGPTTPGSAAYFRITGPRVVIEYSPQAMGGDPTNHIHGVYRDPTDDYGGTVC